jgi:hypothetical protein
MFARVEKCYQALISYNGWRPVSTKAPGETLDPEEKKAKENT